MSKRQPNVFIFMSDQEQAQVVALGLISKRSGNRTVTWTNSMRSVPSTCTTIVVVPWPCAVTRPDAPTEATSGSLER